MESRRSDTAPVVLFGYDSSPFTNKVRLTLQLKQIPYTFVIVPSMMPRPILKDHFNVTYRKIPVLAIGREIYIDTSLILETLEHQFPPSKGYGTIYPSPTPSTTNRCRPLIRGFASYWTDRPLFRVTTGLIPSSVWRTRFGIDRANLIGHKLDPDKLERKVPQNLSGLDLHLSLLEPLFSPGSEERKWIFDAPTPSAADIALWYQLDWGEKISRGEGTEDLTGGGTSDRPGEGMEAVFNGQRYPGLTAWFERVKTFFDGLPRMETRVEREDKGGIRNLLDRLKLTRLLEQTPLLPTPARPHTSLDMRNGLVPGAEVGVAPDDTGRDSPTVGTLVAVTPEEVVITPRDNGQDTSLGELRIHFPRIGFVARPIERARL
ncbi:uncharacterized protein Z518_02414 [Rhinocladiella mackenziei CBS 650.93]|uniref:GST N-terminal domain-containing protein n=1 Tax=Rhinocladiella mackenziei CBS 650.93 TaxID=1442369 RepID=A0A0D2JEY9_9EURO|nr:uncharacterized protein Z518_02414 [Rhinocladiella mackenziei CBS 650.93]KIX07760.1 hypothetical protein Z518_02414 [Rhinocladiella mackenziei CBS 650.93]